VQVIERAGRVLRREETISAAPAPGIDVSDAAAQIPAFAAPAKPSE
jgi:isoquinoline 1-oxidoreductase alpha subunit